MKMKTQSLLVGLVALPISTLAAPNPVAQAVHPTPSSVLLPSGGNCKVLFNGHSCFDRNPEPDITLYAGRGHSPMADLQKAFGDIPASPCYDLRKSDVQVPHPETVLYNENNCPLLANGVVDISCPVAPRSQFWMLEDTCDMRAIEVFDGTGCRGSSYFWNLDFMKQASEEQVVKEGGGAWCAGPGTSGIGGLQRNIGSFRMLEGPPLPEPSGYCGNGVCKGGEL